MNSKATAIIILTSHTTTPTQPNQINQLLAQVGALIPTTLPQGSNHYKIQPQRTPYSCDRVLTPGIACPLDCPSSSSRSSSIAQPPAQTTPQPPLQLHLQQWPTRFPLRSRRPMSASTRRLLEVPSCNQLSPSSHTGVSLSILSCRMRCKSTMEYADSLR